MRTHPEPSRAGRALPWLVVAVAAALGATSWRIDRPDGATPPAALAPTLEERVWRAERGLPAAGMRCPPQVPQSSDR